MIGIYHRSNYLTFLGIGTACAGIFLALRGLTGYGMLCLVICGVCDLFDGVWARRFKRDDRQKTYGVQLDSLTDGLLFGALPVVLLLSLDIYWGIGLAVSVLYALAALNRLAFFNVFVSDAEAPVLFYRGLPVTYAALVLPLVWLIFHGLWQEWAGLAFGTALIVLAGLYVWDIKIPKPKGVAYILFALAAVVVAAGIIWLELI